MTISRHRCTSCLHRYLIIAALWNFILPVIILPQFVRYITGHRPPQLQVIFLISCSNGARGRHHGNFSCSSNPIFHRLSEPDTSFWVCISVSRWALYSNGHVLQDGLRRAGHCKDHPNVNLTCVFQSH